MYYVSINSDQVKQSITDKQKELSKVIGSATKAAYEKGNMYPYKIEVCMFDGSWYGCITDYRTGKEIFSTKFIDITPRCYTSNLDTILKKYDDSIETIKEFISNLKKLKS